MIGRRGAAALLSTSILLASMSIPLAAPPARAATPLPLTPPAPDLAPFVPFAEAPLDKPPLAVMLPPLPPAPDELPVLAPAPVVLPAADRPMAFIPAPRALPCVGAWLRIASESLECGRARLQKAEYEDAAGALEHAVRSGSDRELLREARYWLAETYVRLGRTEQADWLFRQVAQDSPRPEWGVWALHSSGWTALRLRDFARARDAFSQVLSGPAPAPIDAWARHGLGLASYALGRYADARQAWEPVAERAVPDLGRDIRFWYGETLGRVGEHGQAETELGRFVLGGPHPLLASGELRRGWWALAARRYPQSIASFRSYLAMTPRAGSARGAGAPDQDWAEAGLALASLLSGDAEAAARGARALQDRRSPLAVPVLLRLARTAVEARRAAEAHAIVQQVLAGTPTPAVRAWALLVDGEAHRAEGNRDEARTQLDLARGANLAGPIGWQAALRLAQTNFELREFAQAVSDLGPVLAAPAPPEIRAAAVALQAEAAYQAGDRATAAAGFRRALAEFPKHPQAPLLQLGVAWTALRQGRADEARREFLTFVSAYPEHPSAPDALVLASELAVGAGDLDAARSLLDRVVTVYPTHPRTDFARLNRGILMLRSRQFQSAVPALRDWLGRAAFAPLFGRAHVGLGVAFLGTNSVAEAAREFTLARREGVGAVASLGLGTAALVQRRWDDAARALAEARDTGTAAVAGVAEYGLAVVAFHRGAVADLKKAAQAAVAAPGAADDPRSPALLYVLAGIGAGEKDWPAALANARRLVAEYPAHEAADDGLERVGGAAAEARNWPVVYEAYTLLTQRYPQSPFVPGCRLALAEAQSALGRRDEARANLEQFLKESPNDPRAASAWITLARIRESAGDRAAALEAYNRAAKDGRASEWTVDALRGHARLLMEDKRWDQARAILERWLKAADGDAAVEPASAIGDTYRGEGDLSAAAEYYMTAAYLAPRSAAGRSAMLAAARSFAALKQPDSAAIVYRKLLAQPDVPADVTSAARRELGALGR